MTSFVRAASLIAGLVLVMIGSPILSEAQETDTYRALTVQASPGQLLELIDLFKEEQAFARSLGEPPAMMFRHSQGDFWDIFLLYPVKSMAEHFDPTAARRRSSARTPGGMTGAELQAAIDARSAWREEVFVSGPPQAWVASRWAESGFFHLEIFQGLAGKRAELLRQREMENVYLKGIGRDPNGIFVRIAGASSDAFTIGFYRDLAHYAEPNSVSDEEADRAAIEAGFEGRAFIGSYLRSLLLRHHDTLGVVIP